MKMVCIKEGDWVIDYCTGGRAGQIDNWGPRYGEIVTIKCECPWKSDSWILEEYYIDPSGSITSFTKRRFAPLGDISELTSILESESITESV